ncbi:MAG: TonB-dependent receptor [Gammaproteobacteria bacterium]|nr:TonB-dependent receptor [Gammaproteobacteria bacterium]MBU0848381.1 TonB-dependent receptor [Gammaproteobacteria bacterium]MBU1268216.1 TonB-dependent receptor [Gammaproteobacteria bacterium]MBU1529248.1 TonB-dependent receptor [Gammaproteobacteria bacterium]MBU1780410.1 TonB-dependent receptor [Gammaproteobacteria bacterium]
MNSIRLGGLLLATPAAIAAAFPAFAQDSRIFEPVVVTATRTEQPITEVLADVTVIDRETLDRAGQTSLRELLAQQPGVQMSSNGSYRSNTNVFLRGASATQTILLVDGVRVGSATNGGLSLETIPLESIERIEILRGAASALYGPDAVGGVIQIITRQAGTPRRSVSVGVGTDGQRLGAAHFGGKIGMFGYSLGFSHERGTGIDAKTPAASGLNPDEDRFEASSLNFSLVADVHTDHQLKFQSLYSKGRYGFDGNPSPNPLGLNSMNSEAIANPEVNQSSLQWVAKWVPRWKSTVLVAQSDDKSVNEFRRLSDGAEAGTAKFNTKRDQYSWQNDISFGSDVLTVLGEQRREEVDSTTNYPVKSRTIDGFMASYALNRDQWDALGVLRSDDNSQFGRFNNYALSAGYKLNSQWRLVGSVGSSFQAPTFNQLYFPGFGNPDLQPQRSRAKELGVKYAAAAMAASAVVYENRVQGFITPSTNVQSARATLRGATFAVDRQFDTVLVKASYDYTDPKTEPDNKRIVRIARHVFNLNLSRETGPWQYYGELKLASDREDRAIRFSDPNIELGGYGLLNAGVSRKLNQDLSVSARLNNITDKTYSLANGFTTPGRNLFVSANYSF